jgi:DNA replication licensing factor MCM4
VSEIDLSSPLNYGTPSSAASGHRTPRGGPGSVRGTPIRIRSDIQSERRLRQVNLTPSGGGTAASGPGSIVGTPARGSAPASEGGGSSRGTPRRGGRRSAAAPEAPPSDQPPSEVVPPSENSESAPHLVIWGTDVSVHACKSKFRRFLTTFIEANVEEDERADDFRADEPLYLQHLSEVRAFSGLSWLCKSSFWLKNCLIQGRPSLSYRTNE